MRVYYKMSSLEKAREKRRKKIKKTDAVTTAVEGEGIEKKQELVVTDTVGVAASLTTAYTATLAFLAPFSSYLFAFLTFIFIIN